MFSLSFIKCVVCLWVCVHLFCCVIPLVSSCCLLLSQICMFNRNNTNVAITMPLILGFHSYRVCYSKRKHTHNLFFFNEQKRQGASTSRVFVVLIFIGVRAAWVFVGALPHGIDWEPCFQESSSVVHVHRYEALWDCVQYSFPVLCSSKSWKGGWALFRL